MALCLYSLYSPTAWLDLYQSMWVSTSWLEEQAQYQFPITDKGLGHFSNYFLLPLTVSLLVVLHLSQATTWSTWLTGMYAWPPIAYFLCTQVCFFFPLQNLMRMALSPPCCDPEQETTNIQVETTTQRNMQLGPLTRKDKYTLNIFYPNFSQIFLDTFNNNHKFSANQKKRLWAEIGVQARQWIWHISLFSHELCNTCLWKAPLTLVYHLALGLFFSCMNLHFYPLLQQNLINTHRNKNEKKWRMNLAYHFVFHAASSLATWYAAILLQPVLAFPPLVHSLAQFWLFATAWAHCVACFTTPFIYLKKRDPHSLIQETQSGSVEGFGLIKLEAKGSFSLDYQQILQVDGDDT